MSAAANPVRQAVLWLNDPLNWTNPGGILDRLGEHLTISALAVALGCLVAWPVGLWLGHAGRGGGLVVLVSNATLAIPTLALLTILPLTFLGFGRTPVVVALAVFAVPPLLANAYTGVRQADAEARDAARGMGLSGGQVLRRVELPLAVPYLAAGFRTAAVQVIATAALASFVNGGGLGEIIRTGFGLSIAAGGGQILAGGVLVAGLALLAELLLGIVERLVTPRPLRRGRQRAGLPRPADATGRA
ncbi:ABC transporter permease [Micromonospora profundi]|uniref:ABC transporter permease subunit n=1 Tax=Micromonospora profundi TaxID=1420889 RepID=A0AAJ6HW58_9ACTN|nr:MULTISPECIES: ABC transporter permease subunit [Micromonospora]NJC15836.1 osmoprotectant transport system permease protein [Micromonospora profundi]WLS47282.1 ABC transporter permease subunit [Micromonospora profundi]